MHRLGCVAGCAAALVLGSASATRTGWAVASPEPLAVATKSGPTHLDLFPRPAGLEERVAFWKLVFTRWKDTDVVLHDSMHVQKVYAVLDLSGASPKQVAAVTNAEKQRIRALLLQLDARGPELVPETLEGAERTVFALFRDVDEPRKFRAAAERIRGQAGLREQFAEGVRSARRYLPELEETFRRAGLPTELTRLPLIESCFNLRAYSWRGAAGVWQFMPRTGRLHGLRIDRLVDERRDPLRAGEAAARYLANAYAELGAWPLAITAYNHGTAGIARGVEAVGTTDIAALVERYNGRTFGFAGQNFYAEFLAALDVDRESERFFGRLAFDAPTPSEEVLLENGIGIAQAAEAVELTRERLADYNPALHPRVVKGDAAIPRGYRMRVPAGRRVPLEVALAALVAQQPQRMAEGEVHRVRRGETLTHIARSHGISVKDLMAHNGIDDARRIRVGQLLTLPGSGSTPEIVVADAGRPGQATIRHRVRRGETLQVIARRYGTTVAALKRENGIKDARRVRQNQLIRVPGRKNAGSAPVVVAAATAAVGSGEHRVQRGETLDRIASAYGTTADALRHENGIGDPRRIKAGQVIRIPRRDSVRVKPGSLSGDPVAKKEESGGRESGASAAGSGKHAPAAEPQEQLEQPEQPVVVRTEEPDTGVAQPEAPRAEAPSEEAVQPRDVGTQDVQLEDAAVKVDAGELRPQESPHEQTPAQAADPGVAAGSVAAEPQGAPRGAPSPDPQAEAGAQPAEAHQGGAQDAGAEPSPPQDISKPGEDSAETRQPARKRPNGRRHRAGRRDVT